ncbi:MAG: hypothetical protein ACK5N9_13695, partial [Pirellula sp.]
DSTQVKTVDRGLGVHRFVLKCFFGSAWIAVRSMHDCVSSFYEFWSHATIISIVLSCQCQSSPSHGSHQIRRSMFLSIPVGISINCV